MNQIASFRLHWHWARRWYLSRGRSLKRRSLGILTPKVMRIKEEQSVKLIAFAWSQRSWGWNWELSLIDCMISKCYSWTNEVDSENQQGLRRSGLKASGFIKGVEAKRIDL